MGANGKGGVVGAVECRVRSHVAPVSFPNSSARRESGSGRMLGAARLHPGIGMH